MYPPLCLRSYENRRRAVLRPVRYDFEHLGLTRQYISAYVFEPLGRNFFHFVVDQIQVQLTGQAYRQIHKQIVEGFFACRRVRDVEQHTEAFVGLVVQRALVNGSLLSEQMENMVEPDVSV